jgi:hypothetical protein
MKENVLYVNTRTLALEIMLLMIDWAFFSAASMKSDVLSIHDDHDSVVCSTFMSTIEHGKRLLE